jgi:hypothetical protein
VHSKCRPSPCCDTRIVHAYIISASSASLQKCLPSLRTHRSACSEHSNIQSQTSFHCPGMMHCHRMYVDTRLSAAIQRAFFICGVSACEFRGGGQDPTPGVAVQCRRRCALPWADVWFQVLMVCLGLTCFALLRACGCCILGPPWIVVPRRRGLQRRWCRVQGRCGRVVCLLGVVW